MNLSLKNSIYFLRQSLKKPWVVAILAVLAISAVLIIRGASAGGKNEEITVKRGRVSQEVTVIGKVKPATAADLSLDKGGKVVKINKSVGESVKVGETIIQIDNTELFASLAQAQAAVRYQQAKLTELENTQSGQTKILETKAKTALSDTESARISLAVTIQTAYSSAEDAIHNKVDSFFTDPRTSYPQLLFPVTITPESSIETGRVEVEKKLDSLKLHAKLATTTSDLIGLAGEANIDLAEIKLFLDNVALAVNAVTPGISFDQTTTNRWKSDLSTARTQVNTAITSILSASDKYRSAQSSSVITIEQSDLDKSNVIPQQIEAQRAQVSQAQANANAIYAQISKTYIKSPINGIVTRQDAKLGEFVNSGAPVVSVMSDAKFEVEANLPEADLSKVRVGQGASVILDAYGPDIPFSAVVAAIDPAETIIDGIPTYRTTFQFTAADERIYSGMTANVNIRGESRDNVISIPQRALLTKGTSRYVLLKTGQKEVKEVPVKTGLRGSDGSIEITEGLQENDVITVLTTK